MSSSIQSETSEGDLTSELCQGGIDIKELKPWHHLKPQTIQQSPKPIPVKGTCNKFEKIIKSLSNFETLF